MNTGHTINNQSFIGIVAETNLTFLNAIASNNLTLAKVIGKYLIQQAFMTYAMDNDNEYNNNLVQLKNINKLLEEKKEKQMTELEFIIDKYKSMGIDNIDDAREMVKYIIYYQNKAGFKAIQTYKISNPVYDNFNAEKKMNEQTKQSGGNNEKVS